MVLTSIVRRYGGRDRRLSLEDFITVMCKLTVMYGRQFIFDTLQQYSSHWFDSINSKWGVYNIPISLHLYFHILCYTFISISLFIIYLYRYFPVFKANSPYKYKLHVIKWYYVESMKAIWLTIFVHFLLNVICIWKTPDLTS